MKQIWCVHSLICMHAYAKYNAQISCIHECSLYVTACEHFSHACKMQNVSCCCFTAVYVIKFKLCYTVLDDKVECFSV